MSGRKTRQHYQIYFLWPSVFCTEGQMNYPETLEYLYAKLPMYHRIGAAAYKADLKNTIALCDALHHPEKKFRSIHIAGTNGKGSSSHMLAAILQTAGYKTGLYTSPHLKDFRERIRINGKMIPQDNVISFVEAHKNQFEKIDLSFFEWTVGLCFEHFANEKVDIAVIETGLGGRLDSTNVITPEISLITNISFDHKNLLGDTLQKIAIEKAGIIKKNIPVVIGEEEDATKNIFMEFAKANEAPIYFPSAFYQVTNVSSDKKYLSINVSNGDISFPRLQLDLTGEYQLKNIIGVLEVVHRLQQAGWKIEQQHIYSALKNVKQLTGLMGRWQRISESPLTICDVGHNVAGIKEVLNQLKHTPYEHLHFVIGMVNDKDIDDVLDLLPRDATYYFCKANIPRALNAEELKSKAKNFNLKGEAYPSVAAAFNAAKSSAKKDDLVFVGGSTFVVGEVV